MDDDDDPRDIIADTRDILATVLRGCRACWACWATSPFMQLDRLGLRSAAVYSAVRLSVCRVALQIPQARHARLVADKLLASS